MSSEETSFFFSLRWPGATEWGDRGGGGGQQSINHTTGWICVWGAFSQSALIFTIQICDLVQDVKEEDEDIMAHTCPWPPWHHQRPLQPTEHGSGGRTGWGLMSNPAYQHSSASRRPLEEERRKRTGWSEFLVRGTKSLWKPEPTNYSLRVLVSDSLWNFPKSTIWQKLSRGQKWNPAEPCQVFFFFFL